MQHSSSLPWTEEENKILFDHYAKHGSDFCSHVLQSQGSNRNRRAVFQHANILGLKYQGQPKGRFKKGQISHNKGKKMPAELYVQCAPTMFKKGTLNGAAKDKKCEVGSETFRIDGYWYVKVAEKKWVAKHHLVWQQIHGPIPPKMLLIFRDGNPHNCTIDNLELITRAQNAVRNRHGQGPSEYSLITARAAKVKLKKKGITPQQIRDNPELLDLAQKQTLLKLKMRRKNATQG